jgi:peptidoglycan-associated lipoprotein
MPVGMPTQSNYYGGGDLEPEPEIGGGYQQERDLPPEANEDGGDDSDRSVISKEDGKVKEDSNKNSSADNNDGKSFENGKIDGNGKYTGKDGVSKSGIKLLYFARDSYTLEEDQLKRLVEDLPKVKRLAKEKGGVLIEGNCDEFGTDEYNYALGLKRAKAVKSALVDLGVNGSRIQTVSYGESNPVCTESDEPACHAKNRRAEINRGTLPN